MTIESTTLRRAELAKQRIERGDVTRHAQPMMCRNPSAITADTGNCVPTAHLAGRLDTTGAGRNDRPSRCDFIWR